MAIGRVPGATGIQPSIVDAKGDLIAATAADSVSRLAAGSNNQVLMADSAQATGLKYANEATATLTTTGDILYASAANTPARLAIGSTDQVLKVSGGIPAWATASSGAMTKIGTTTFSNVATQDINSVFTSTYNSYLINISGVYAATEGDDLQLQMRYGSTTETTGYYGNLTTISGAGGQTITNIGNAAQATLALACGASGYPTSTIFYIVFPSGGGVSSRAYIYGQSFNRADLTSGEFAIGAEAQTYTGFRLKSSSTNITGNVVVYGLEK